MSSILKKLLFLAENENNKRSEFKSVNLKELLTELVYDIELLCEDKALDLHLDIHDDLIVKGDKISLRDLFLNLVDNAIKYTSSGGSISVTLNKQENGARVTIKDTGIGILTEHIPHLFERFYRVDKSSLHGRKGSGLGLSICQSIVELHGGKIEVQSKVGAGSVFSVILPFPEKCCFD